MIKYFIIDRKIYFNEREMFSVPTTYTIDEIQKIYLVRCRSKSYIRTYPELMDYTTDEEFLSRMNIIELPKPNTFPKFKDCLEVRIKWSGKIKIGKIIAVRWNGDGWDYQLENIGHKYDFQPEEKILND